MKYILTATITLFALQVSAFADKTRPLLYPFDVTIGGQTAQMEKGNGLFAVIEKPVKADAVLEIEKAAPMLILNAFACKPNGAVMEAGQQPAVIFAQNTKTTNLNATMDKQALKPGRYLANIVAHNKTSRVVFVVEDSSGKTKAPSLKLLIDFLQKKK